MKLSTLNPDKYFITISLLAGVILCFIIPIGAGYDEDTHVARIWEISKGVLIPNQLLSTGPNFPSIFYELSYRQKLLLEPIGLSFYEDNLNQLIDWNNMIFHETRSYYFPSSYLLQAFIMGLLGRVFDTPVMIILYLCRLSYLLIYVMLVYLAIKTAPFGKWIFAILGLTPMALVQAANISADPITNAGSFLFIAFLLKLRNNPEKFSYKKLIILIGIIAFLFSLKMNASVLVLLLFLVPKRKFRDKKQLIILAVMVVILFGLVVVGWNFLAITIRGNKVDIAGVNPFEQMTFIFLNPFRFFSTLISSLYQNSIQIMKEWVGVMGYRYWSYPAFLYPLVFLFVFIAVWMESPSPLKISERVLLSSICIVGFIISASAMYLMMNPVGSATINGIDGRYMIPFMPLLFIALIPRHPTLKFLLKKILIFGYSLIVLIMVLSVFLVYHVNCGASYFTTGYCYQPVYKNWEPDQKYLEPLRASTEYKQTYIASCSSMTEVRLWMKNINASSAAKTILQVIDPISEKKVGELAINNTFIKEKGWIRVDFPQVEDSENRKFEIHVTTDAKFGEGLEMAISTRDEYSQGYYSEDGNSNFNFDLIFQYGCIQGISRLFGRN